MKAKKLKVKKSKKIKIKKFFSFFINKNNKKIAISFFLLLAIYLVIAFISFLFNWKSDDSIVVGNKINEIITNVNLKNNMGGLGAYISHILIKQWFGLSAFLIPILFILFSLKLLNISNRYIKLGRFFSNTMIFLIIIPITLRHFFKSTIYAGGIGIHLEQLLTSLIGNIGTTLFLITIFILYISIYFDINSKNLNFLIQKIKNIKIKKEPLSNQNPEIKEEVNQSNNEEIFDSNNVVNLEEENLIETPINTGEKEDSVLNIEIKDTIEEEKLSNIEIEKKLEELGEYDPTLELSKYQMPKMDLLNNYGNNTISIDKNDLEEKKDKIVETLGHYKIGISSISATVGPTITLYEIVPDAGVRISKIKNLEDDIALSLAAEGIRIIAPIPGKGTIGIEVPNKKKNTVSMLEVLMSENFQKNDKELPIAFGKTISNETFVVDLAKMPHLLMAGATGQGKSVGLNVILASLLFKKHPSQIKFVLVDPKKVELTLFNKIEKHYLAKLPDGEDAIITDTKKVINTINSLCIEMDERYELCKTAQCRNIKEYNAKFISRKLNPNYGHRYLPYIVLVIDEFADLIMTAGKEIETPIARLAQLARAIGIHLIIATQRPSVNVITGIIKANFPARVAFRVTSTTDSRTIMDSKGAEQLIGMGDMLISTGSELTRLQCAFIDTPEVEKLCDFIGSQRGYTQAHMLPEYEGAKEVIGGSADLDEKDDLFNEAAHVVVKHQSGSTSLIQRKLKLGYNRAGRIIDQLEAANIVGPFEGSKARQVLIKDELALEEVLKNI
ncbi:MAG: cell division protein FtsK [Flavobacteriales bacterium]|nr:cell division protein FtsK [Flavobacteriales bacterium]